MRWNSREFSLNIFKEWYDAILDAFEQISTGRSFDADTRCTAGGLLNAFVPKQFIATSILFRESFAITGPLSRTSVDQNFEGVKWEEKRDIRRKRMSDENAPDDESPTEWMYFMLQLTAWYRGSKIASRKAERFLKHLWCSPRNVFRNSLLRFSLPVTFRKKPDKFCETYNINAYLCANELFTSAAVFKRFNKF